MLEKAAPNPTILKLSSVKAHSASPLMIGRREKFIRSPETLVFVIVESTCPKLVEAAPKFYSGDFLYNFRYSFLESFTNYL